MTDFEALGEEGFDFDAAWRAVEPDDVLCLIYTSGTTGPPKGVQLTHGNMMSVWRSLDEVVDFTPAGRSVSFLPTAHVADRWAQLYGSMVYGHTVHCCPDPREMVAYSIEVKPTVWGGVPRIWEKLKAALEAGFAAEQDEARKAGDLGGARDRARARKGEAGRRGPRRAGAAVGGRGRAAVLEDPCQARARRVRVVRRSARRRPRPR